MQVIKYTMLMVLLYAGSAMASENIECLKHLGAGMSDISCYHELTEQENRNNDAIIIEVLKTMPKNSKIKDIFRKNTSSTKTNTMEFCNIKRLAADSWKKEKSDHMSEHKYTDVIYYECLYKLTKKTGENLASLIDEYKKEN
ncbi:hypothetical protein [Iodobacter sp.]|uniref:hypothetical protein n=1 Tax=Iodobacter sp. TaxID=1915058 RepID=UPI0025DB8680|nr:hypothetical protein [Iodobacter sp.]